MTDDAKKSTETKKTAETKKSEKSEERLSEKAASGQRHVREPGLSEALRGPSQDDLNPAYAPLTDDDE